MLLSTVDQNQSYLIKPNEGWSKPFNMLLSTVHQTRSDMIRPNQTKSKLMKANQYVTQYCVPKLIRPDYT